MANDGDIRYKPFVTQYIYIIQTINSMRVGDAYMRQWTDHQWSPERRQSIIWTNAGILLIGLLGTNFSEILIEIHSFIFKKMH